MRSGRSPPRRDHRLEVVYRAGRRLGRGDDLAQVIGRAEAVRAVDTERPVGDAVGTDKDRFEGHRFDRREEEALGSMWQEDGHLRPCDEAEEPTARRETVYELDGPPGR